MNRLNRIMIVATIALSFESAGGAALVSEKALAENLKLYASISSLEVGFKQTKTLKDMQIQLKSEGHLTLHRPDQVRWEITQPSPVVVSLNKTQISIQTGKGHDAETQTFKMGAGQDSATKSMTGLIAWLNLDSKALSEQYQIFDEGKRSFRFEPKHKEGSPFKNLDMQLGSDGQLKHLTLHEISGDTLDIEFGKAKLTYK